MVEYIILPRKYMKITGDNWMFWIMFGGTVYCGATAETVAERIFIILVAVMMGFILKRSFN